MLKFYNSQAISPLDGRYNEGVKVLADYFSEFALFKYRLEIEVKYLIFLADNVNVIPPVQIHLSDFSENDFQKIKTYEKETRHDIKALEYFLRDKYPKYANYWHLGLTSEDTNNLAYSLLLSKFIQKEYLPKASELIGIIKKLAKNYSSVVMLGRTHGQAAVPTTLGKEFAVYADRLRKVLQKIEKLKMEGKLNGAVGNWNALLFAFPDVDWINKSSEFIESLGLYANPISTQIESSDSIVRLFNGVRHFNNILIGLCQDLWRYISDGYLILKKEEKEVGSSTMPQKVNPIDFENAEGNMGIANSLLDYFSNKLPISRLQRDLSDSTVKRNFGVAFGHSMLSLNMILRGLNKISPNSEKMLEDMNSNWSVLSEAVQVYLRANGQSEGYEMVKKYTRGIKMNEKDYLDFINNLKIDLKFKNKLRELTPEKYVGLAKELTKLI